VTGAAMSFRGRMSGLRPVDGALVVVGTGSTIAVLLLASLSGPASVGSAVPLMVGLVVSFLVAGAIVGYRAPEHPVARLLLTIGVLNALGTTATEYAERGLVIEPGSLPAADIAAWLSDVAWFPAILLMFGALPAFLPSGSLDRLGRRTIIAVIGGIVVLVVSLAIGSWAGRGGSFVGNADPLTAPFVIVPLALAGLAAVLGGTLVGLGSFVRRARRVTGTERQQLRVLVFGVGVAVIGLAVTFAPFSGSVYVGLLLMIAFPASIGVAVLRYRLWDLDLVIARTLTYGGLSIAVTSLYLVTVGTVGVLFNARSQGPVVVVGVVAVALLAEPLRNRFQRAAELLALGSRRNTGSALAELRRRWDGQRDGTERLERLVGDVLDVLRLDWVAIRLERGEDDQVVASAGSQGPASIAVALDDRGVRFGVVELGTASPDELRERDRDALEAVARQTGDWARSLLLAEEVAVARQATAVAREEERRRIRRDLHDGVGPTLAAVAAGLDVAAESRDVDGDRELLCELRSDLSDAIRVVRELARDIRPPALDDLGLAAALGAHADRMGKAGPDYHVDVAVATLSPAVEVATYRISVEAMTNVARHAAARRCSVKLSAGDGLTIIVEDDGAGLPAGWRPGVGVMSMRERAEELGGRLSMGANAAGGTRVVVWIPMVGR